MTLRWNGFSGSPKGISAAPGSVLAPATAQAPEVAARAFLASRAALFGLSPGEVDRLRLLAVLTTPAGGPHVHFTQRAGGLDVFGSHVKVNLAHDGSVRSAGSTLFGRIAPTTLIAIAPLDAVRIATADVYPSIAPPAEIESEEEEGECRAVFSGEGFGFPPEARLVVFPEAEGSRLAWEVRVAEPSLFTSYVIVVDAADGRLLYRENTTLYAEAAYLDAESPNPMTEELAAAAYVRATIPASTPESPIGWITGAGTSLTGNRAAPAIRSRSPRCGAGAGSRAL